MRDFAVAIFNIYPKYVYRKVVQDPVTSLNCFGMYGKACFKASSGLYETKLFSNGGACRAVCAARCAPRGAKTRVQFVKMIISPKKFFLANPSETSPQGRTYHQLSRG